MLSGGNKTDWDSLERFLTPYQPTLQITFLHGKKCEVFGFVIQ